MTNKSGESKKGIKIKANKYISKVSIELE